MQFTAASTTTPTEVPATAAAVLVDRRQHNGAAPQGQERRQFLSSYGELSPDARELALAIDSYKIEHRRRYLTFEEMLLVIKKLGYEKQS